MRRHSKTSGWARILLINAGLLAGILLVAEAVFGAWFSARNFGALNILVDRHIVYDATGLYQGGGKVDYSRDIWGLRGPHRNPAEIDILTIGGSTTDQRYVADGATFQDVMGQRLAQGGISAVVANAGVDGHSTIGHLRAFDLWFPHISGLKPSLVLAFIGINDASLSPTQAEADSFHEGGALERAKRSIANNSALYRLFRTVQGMRAATAAQVMHGQVKVGDGTWAPLSAPQAEPSADPAAIAAYGSRVSALIERIHAFGAKAVIVTQGAATYRIRDGRPWGILRGDGSVDPGSWPLYSAFNRAAMDSCRTTTAICVDLGGELEFQEGDFYDIIHTAPAGSARIGTFLADRLASDITALCGHCRK